MRIDAGFVSLDIAEVLLLGSEGLEEVEQVCRKAYDLFASAGVRPAAEKALACLREAAIARKANQPLVKSVKTFLRLLDRDASAEFEPARKT
jgi:hypothetical protein